jgi:hypothetical protein
MKLRGQVTNFSEQHAPSMATHHPSPFQLMLVLSLHMLLCHFEHWNSVAIFERRFCYWA